MSERRIAPLATLLAAAFVFRLGNAMARIALPWLVLAHTGSAAWAGITAASSVVATILGAWLGGGLVDRIGAAPVALISGVAGGVATSGISLFYAFGALSPTGLLTCVVLGAAFDAPGMAAQDSHLPELGRIAGLSVERLSSLKSVMSHVAYLGGPALGGASVGLIGAAPTLWLAATCSIVAALLAAKVLPVQRFSTTSTASGFSMSLGSSFIWGEPLLRPLFGLMMLFTGIAGANGSVILPALFLEAERPAAELGLFSSAMGAGGLAGIAVHAWASSRIPPQRWLAASFSAFALVSLLLSMVPELPLLIALGAFLGMMTGPLSPILNAAIYTRTPSELLGRVLGAISAVMLSAAPAVMLAAGGLVETTGPGPTLVVSAAIAAGVAILTLRLRFKPLASPGLSGEDGAANATGAR